MDAMILAAGLGTRLGSITRDAPKALVDVAGSSVLERVARGLIAAGADRLIINVHHHADRVVEHVRARGDFGVEVVFSPEPDAPLETGGGLLHAAPLFRGDRPFFLHNVDVLCEADLPALYAAHEATTAVATLAVHDRPSSRRLLFARDRLVGRAPAPDAGSATDDRRSLAFAGIHVIAPAFLGMITERGAFSIMDVYLRLAAAGNLIRAHDIGSVRWLEVGNPERLAAARRAFGG